MKTRKRVREFTIDEFQIVASYEVNTDKEDILRFGHWDTLDIIKVDPEPSPAEELTIESKLCDEITQLTWEEKQLNY